MSDDDSTWPCVPLEEMRAFMVRCMESVATPNAHAHALAELLLKADYRGHYSHGLNRLDMYVTDIKTGATSHGCEPEIIHEKAATAWVDGKNLLGPVVGQFCIDLAIKKAKEAGIGMVVAKGSNHYGIAGWYAMRALDHGMLGMSCTNTSPLVVPTRATKGMAFTNTSPVVYPTRGTKGILGTNPISLAAPATGQDSFVLDMATSAVAYGKVELAERKGKNIPSGWGCNREGEVVTDPAKVLTGGGLLPLGGTEECSGYKGYGLGMMVEVLCGILGGAHFGPNIRQWKETHGLADLEDSVLTLREQWQILEKGDLSARDVGQCFMVIDPSSFAPGFPERMSSLMGECRGLQPMAGQTEVLVPGDPERKHIEMCEKRGGIPYHPNQIQYANDLAKVLGVEPPKVLSA